MDRSAAMENLCEEEFLSLKGRSRGDDSLLKEAIVSMTKEAFANPLEEVPELSPQAEKIINKWRGDSRSGGLEMALVSTWNRARRLAQKIRD